jgi:hypothetical protein
MDLCPQFISTFLSRSLPPGLVPWGIRKPNCEHVDPWYLYCTENRITIGTLTRRFRPFCMIDMVVPSANDWSFRQTPQTWWQTENDHLCGQEHWKRIHQNCSTLLHGNCFTSYAAKSCYDSPLWWVEAKQDLTAPIFSIHQSLCGNCQKVCWHKLYILSSLLTQGSKRCLNNCLTLVKSPPGINW